MEAGELTGGYHHGKTHALLPGRLPCCHNARKALAELVEETPGYGKVSVDWIEESRHPELLQGYEYYLSPASSWGSGNLPRGGNGGLAGTFDLLNLKDKAFPLSDYMFPAPGNGLHTAKWLDRHFRSLWRIAYPESAAKVRVYDLRHRFATTILMQWIDSGEDFFTALPYLSAYMGRSDFSSTAYYVHLLPERLLKSAAIDWQRFEGLLPEVNGYEQ